MSIEIELTDTMQRRSKIIYLQTVKVDGYYNPDDLKEKSHISISSNNIDRIEQIIDDIGKYDLKGKTFYISLENETYLNANQCQQLFHFREILHDKGADFKILDGGFFDIEDLVASNEKMDRVINKINSATIAEENNRPLTDLEKFLWAYHYVAKRKYVLNEEDLSSPRSITSIFKTGDIVCVGFAALLKEMCNRLNIECYTNSCIVTEENGTKFGHANNIVVLGGKAYYCDACFDCFSESKPKDNYLYCLLSPEDLNNTKGLKITEHTAPFFNIESDKKMLEQLLEDPNGEEYSKLYNKYKSLIPKYQPMVDNNNAMAIVNFFGGGNTNKTDERMFYLGEIKKMLNKYANDKISLDEFEKALTTVYLYNNKSKDDVKDVISYNMQRANEKFDDKPSRYSENCQLNACL